MKTYVKQFSVSSMAVVCLVLTLAGTSSSGLSIAPEGWRESYDAGEADAKRSLTNKVLVLWYGTTYKSVDVYQLRFFNDGVMPYYSRASKKVCPVDFRNETNAPTHKVSWGYCTAYNAIVRDFLEKKYGENVFQKMEDQASKIFAVEDPGGNFWGQTYKYKLKKGDSLWALAKSHRTTVEHLQRFNNMETSRIVVGEFLELPIVEKASKK